MTRSGLKVYDADTENQMTAIRKKISQISNAIRSLRKRRFADFFSSSLNCICKAE
jgi:hypothetical protein